MATHFAVNPATGERLMYMEGQGWVPAVKKPAAAAGGGSDAATKADVARIAELRDAADSSLGTARSAEEFSDINRRKGTGGLNGIGFPWPGGGSIGDVAAMFDPDVASMRSITNRVAPRLRVPGSGASSDKDVKMFVSGFPNIDAPGPANARNTSDWKAQANYDAAHRSFMETWMAKTGALTGADEAFTKYWSEHGEAKYGPKAMRGQKPAPATAAPAGPKYLGTE